MRRVVYSLVPIFLWSVYLYGWRTIALAAVIFPLGILVEFVMEKSRNKKISEAVLVTCALFTLSMPPAVPLWVAAVGIIFGVLFGKEVYGGFGRNIFNPAITGRTFTYISFPLMMQTTWMLPGMFGIGGVNHQVIGSTWLEAIFMIAVVFGVYYLIIKNPGNTKLVLRTAIIAVVVTVAFYVISAYAGFRTLGMPWTEVDVVTSATPLEIMRGLAAQNHWVPKPGWEYLQDNSLINLFLGFRMGSLGEGAIFLIIGAGIYLLMTKTANWRPMVWTLVSAVGFTALFYYLGSLGARFPQLTVKPDLGGQISDQLKFAMSGALIFGAVFMATDPVSAPKKPIALALYGIIIGSVTIVIRTFAGFPEGISFAILTANTFGSLIDEILPARKKKAVAGEVSEPAEPVQGAAK